MDATVKLLERVMITQIDQVEYEFDLLVDDNWALMTSTSFNVGENFILSILFGSAMLQSDSLMTFLLFKLIHLKYLTNES